MAVLWILAMLSALVSIYTVFVINTAAGFAVHDDRFRAEALVSAAIELTAYHHLSAPRQPPPTRGQFLFRLEKANVAVEYLSEAARIDLNAAPKQLLVGLFLALGASQQAADTYADRIIAWRQSPANGQQTEVAAYRTARLEYSPRGAKFPHASELSLVRDLPFPIMERALPFVTVYSGRPQVNVLDAAPQVIAALPGMSAQRVDAVLARRQTEPGDGAGLLPLLGAAQQYVTTEGSKALRVTVRIGFDNGRQTSSEVIILVFEQGDRPFAVFSWRDELDAPPPNLRRAGLR